MIACLTQALSVSINFHSSATTDYTHVDWTRMLDCYLFYTQIVQVKTFDSNILTEVYLELLLNWLLYINLPISFTRYLPVIQHNILYTYTKPFQNSISHKSMHTIYKHTHVCTNTCMYTQTHTQKQTHTSILLIFIDCVYTCTCICNLLPFTYIVWCTILLQLH